MMAVSPAIPPKSIKRLTMMLGLFQAFENTSTSVAASQMRNALNNLADTVKDTHQKKVGYLVILIRRRPIPKFSKS